MHLQCPDGLFGDAEQSRRAGHDEDEQAEEAVHRKVGGAQVRRKARKQEGDQTGKPLKQIRKVFAHKHVTQYVRLISNHLTFF